MLQALKLRRLAFATFNHWGALGLFFLAIIDSSPLPTFCGPDLLTIVLVTTRSNPWWEYPAVATAGSTIGAYITFRLARKAEGTYLESKFGSSKVSTFLAVFKQAGTGSLVASAAIPFPFPTSLVFAAAGASDYRLGKFLAITALSRGARYTVIALLAHLYGRHLARILLHPGQYWGWFLVLSALVLILAGAGFLLNRRLFTSNHT